MHKKVIFYLLIMVVVSGMITFGLYHYKKSQDPIKDLPYVSWGKGRIMLIPKEDKDQRHLMEQYSHCSLFRGIPLEVEQEEPGVFTINKLSPLPEHRGVSLEKGDKILAVGLLLKPSEKVGMLKKITVSGEIENISYEPAVVFYCIP